MKQICTLCGKECYAVTPSNIDYPYIECVAISSCCQSEVKHINELQKMGDK